MENGQCGIGGTKGDPAHKTEEDAVTQEKPGTQEEVCHGDRSHHELSASTITTIPKYQHFVLVPVSLIASSYM